MLHCYPNHKHDRELQLGKENGKRRTDIVIGTINRFDYSRIGNILHKHASGLSVVRLDFPATSPQREREQVRYVLIPYRNAEKLALSFHIGARHTHVRSRRGSDLEPCLSKYNHTAGAAGIKSIDCLSRPVFTQSVRWANSGVKVGTGAWGGERKRVPIDIGGTLGDRRCLSSTVQRSTFNIRPSFISSVHNSR